MNKFYTNNQTNKSFTFVWLLAILLNVLLFSNGAKAQISSMVYSSSNPVAYSTLVISAGTQVNNTSTDDDDVYALQNIGFNFGYCGNTFTTVGITANGYLKLGAVSSNYYSAAPSNQANTISAFNNDLQGAGLTNSKIRIQTIGSAPSRVCVVQFSDWSYYPYSTSVLFNFQIRLSEIDGKVEIVYGPVTPYSYTLSVGVSGSTTADLNMLSSSTTWTSPSVLTTGTGTMTLSTSVYPDSGRTYTWGNPPMVIDSVSTVQALGNALLGASNQAAIAAVWYTRGATNPKTMSQIVFNTSGTTNVADLTAARVLYTGSNPNFTMAAVIRQFGSDITSPSGSLTFNGLDTLRSGPNYYWLVYDITTNVNALGRVIDGTCTSVTDSAARTPNITSPAGNRVIIQPMGGVYTINPVGTGPLNFTTFAAAITALGNGVVSAVTFNVAAATYNEQVVIPSTIPGVSHINTITFDGGNGNAATRIITGGSGGAGPSGSATFLINGARYIRVRNLTINNNSSAAVGFAIVGSSASYNGSNNSLSRCIINIPVQSGTASTGYLISVTASVGGMGVSAMGADSTVIDSNVATGGGYGIVHYGMTNGAYNRGIRIRGNTITTNYMGGYVAYNFGQFEVKNNTFNMGAGYGYYGLYFYYNQNSSTSIPTQIIGNTWNNFGGYGMYCYYPSAATSTAPLEVYNNMWWAGAGSSYPGYYGLYLYQPAGAISLVYHNTWYMGGAATSTTYCGMYNNGSSSTFIKNNIFSVGAGSATPLYLQTSPTGNIVNYNNYYNWTNITTGNLLYRGTFYTPSTYKTATAGGDSSFNVAPSYVNRVIPTVNLHLLDNCNPKGVDLTAIVPLDIDNQTRSVTPNVGADEAGSFSLDVMPQFVVSPVAPIVTGAQDLIIKIKNVGTTQLTAFNISYRHNLGTPVSQTWFGTLDACDTTSVIFTGSQQITLVGTNQIKIYTDAPNFSSDANVSNDTINVSMFAPMSGVYTIGGTGADFATFSAAASAVSTAGLAGAVRFVVAAGTYNDRLVIPNTVIPGLSAVNTIVFDGGNGNATTRVLTNNSISGAVIQISGQKYITIRNLTVTNQAAMSGISFVGSVSNYNNTGCGVQGCIVNIPVQSGTSSAGWGITFSAGAGAASAQGGDSITVDSNIVNGGSYGIVVYGSTNVNFNRFLRVRNNTINSNNYMGCYIAYNYNAIDFIGNKVYMQGVNYGYYGVYYYGNQNGSTTVPHRFNNNQIYGFGGYGVYWYYPTSSVSTATTQVYNNIVRGGLGTSYPGYYGMYYMMQNAGVSLFYHNTFHMPGAGASTSYTGCYISGSTATVIKNNMFIVTNGSYTPLYLGTSPTGNLVNYNIYYNSTGTTAPLLYRNGNWTSANYLSNTAGGDTSYNVVPPVVSLTTPDFHLSNGCIRGFDLTTDVPLDLDLLARSTAPNIGPYEYPAVALDIAPSAIITPSFPISSGAQNLRVRISNNGGTTVTAFNIAYRLNNATAVIQGWTGSLNSCDTTSVLFTGSQQVTLLNGTNTLKVYTYAPNGSADLNTFNDTLNTQLSTPMSGTYVIGVAPSDFTTFATAIAAMQLRGVGGAINFVVKTATYSESVTVPSGIQGLNATSTVTFRSIANNSDSVIVNGNGTSTTLVVSGASYVNFSNMTITTTNAGVGSLVMSGVNTGNTFYNVKFINLPYTTAATYILYTQGSTLTDVTFRRCLIQGGYYGAWIYNNGTTWNNRVTIDSSTFNNIYYYPMYLYYGLNTRITNNQINGNGASGVQYFYTYYQDSAYTIANNRFDMASNISNVYSYLTYYAVGNAVNRVRVNNNIFTLANSNCYFYGYWYYGTYNDYFNNVINTGLGYMNFGGGDYHRIYNNTIFGNSSSYTSYQISGYTGTEIKNNHLINNGGAYSLYWSGAPGVTEISDYNNYFSTNPSNAVYQAGAYNINALRWLATNITQKRDQNSVSYRPAAFTSTTNFAPSPADSAVWSLNGRGIQTPWIANDLNNNARPTTLAAGVPDIGAFEVTPTSLPPLATPSGAPTAGATQSFTFAGDTVAKVSWDASLTPPSTLFIRQYTTKPASIGTALYYMYFYNAISASNTGTFSYDLKMNYKKAWLGTLVNLPTATLDGNLTVAQKATPFTSAWANVSTGAGDSVLNTVTGQYLSTFGWFTASDITYPVPVNLVNLNANLSGNNVLVNWITASEQNSDRYVVERSIDGTIFAAVGTVKAAGNSNTYQSYLFTDAGAKALIATGTMYYRLAMYDRDGHMEYSKVVSVSNNNDVDVSLFPNPFNNQLVLNINSNEAGNVTVAILDINGKQQYSSSIAVSKGSNTKVLEGFEGLSSGIYFARINSETSVKVIKLIKK